jgi:hypothetical protein
VILTGSGYVLNSSGGDAQFLVSLLIDGSVVNSTFFFIPSTNHGGFSLSWEAAISGAGSHTVNMEITQQTGSGSSSSTAFNCSLIAQVVNV